MAKVLLIHPPHEQVNKARKRGLSFPYGIGYIAGQLLKDGHNIEILDIHAINLNEAEVVEKVRGFDGDIIGISAFSTQYRYVKWLSEQIKRLNYNCKVVIGGPLATYNSEIVLTHACADICVIGEGELTMQEVVKNIDSLDKVEGIYFRNNDTIRKNKPRPLINDLDSIPQPAYQLFPMDIYLRQTHLMNMEYSEYTLSVITGRGCAYSCNFCSKTFPGIRLRSVKDVTTEIKFLKDSYNITDIAFNDELFVSSKKRTYEFIERLAPLKLRWSCQARVNIVDYPLLKAMKKAGCVMVGFGLESGSQEILNRMNKGITVEQSEAAMKAAIKAGLAIKVQLMFNYPGDSKETIQQTIALMKRVGHAAREFAITTALPRTKLYQECIEKGIIKNEEEYLKNLSYGYKRSCPILINFTELNTKELYPLIKWATEQMRRNYKWYVITHPSRWKDVFLRKIKNGIGRLFNGRNK